MAIMGVFWRFVVAFMLLQSALAANVVRHKRAKHHRHHQRALATVGVRSLAELFERHELRPTLADLQGGLLADRFQVTGVLGGGSSLVHGYNSFLEDPSPAGNIFPSGGRFLGNGAYGTVYKAADSSGGDVAIKFFVSTTTVKQDNGQNVKWFDPDIFGDKLHDFPPNPKKPSQTSLEALESALEKGLRTFQDELKIYSVLGDSDQIVQLKGVIYAPKKSPSDPCIVLSATDAGNGLGQFNLAQNAGPLKFATLKDYQADYQKNYKDSGCLFTDVRAMVMELCDGDLDSPISLRTQATWESMNTVRSNRDWALDIINSVKYMHDKGVMHFDIKPDNIFRCPRDNNGKSRSAAVLGDFGLSNNDAFPKARGTLNYKPPEFIGYDFSKDMDGDPFQFDLYSTGITLFQLLGASGAQWADEFQENVVEPTIRSMMVKTHKNLRDSEDRTQFQLDPIVLQNTKVNYDNELASRNSVPSSYRALGKVIRDWLKSLTWGGAYNTPINGGLARRAPQNVIDQFITPAKKDKCAGTSASFYVQRCYACNDAPPDDRAPACVRVNYGTLKLETSGLNELVTGKNCAKMQNFNGPSYGLDILGDCGSVGACFSQFLDFWTEPSDGSPVPYLQMIAIDVNNGQNMGLIHDDGKAFDAFAQAITKGADCLVWKDTKTQ